MSTTEDETVSIWLDRHAMPRTDWSDRSEVDLTVDGDTVVMTWHEWDVRGTQSERRHVFHGSTRALAEQVGDIRAGGCQPRDRQPLGGRPGPFPLEVTRECGGVPPLRSPGDEPPSRTTGRPRPPRRG